MDPFSKNDDKKFLLSLFIFLFFRTYVQNIITRRSISRVNEGPMWDAWYVWGKWGWPGAKAIRWEGDEVDIKHFSLLFSLNLFIPLGLISKARQQGERGVCLMSMRMKVFRIEGAEVKELVKVRDGGVKYGKRMFPRIRKLLGTHDVTCGEFVLSIR